VLFAALDRQRDYTQEIATVARSWDRRGAVPISNSARRLGREATERCPFCDGLEKETVAHFLLRCSLWAEAREKFLRRIWTSTSSGNFAARASILPEDIAKDREAVWAVTGTIDINKSIRWHLTPAAPTERVASRFSIAAICALIQLSRAVAPRRVERLGKLREQFAAQGPAALEPD
jgi:hypothetical protein